MNGLNEIRAGERQEVIRVYEKLRAQGGEENEKTCSNLRFANPHYVPDFDQVDKATSKGCRPFA